MFTDKANVICLLNIFKEYSDEKHILSMKEIIANMKSIYDIDIDRRTVYGAVDVLNCLGYDISSYNENKQGYYLRERDFEQSEIQMLTDAVCSLIYLNKRYEKIAVKYKLPKWFIDFCNNVKYLFPRAHIAEGFIYTSKFEYYRHNYPEAFEKVCSEIENGVLKVYK